MIFQLNDEQITLAVGGGKGLNLRRLVQAELPVPDGFVLSTAMYRQFVAVNRLQPQIDALSRGLQAGDMGAFTAASRAIRNLFQQAALPQELADPIRAAYGQLGGAVAVRSSATAEDLPGASFAGQQESYLHVEGEEALLEAVRRCWASLWTARAIAYRQQQGIIPEGVALAVVVQQMVPADAAGVLFTVNPVTGHPGEMMINATWGLGEALVSGQVNPDTLVVDKENGRIKSLQIGDKAVMTTAAEKGTIEVSVAPEQQAQAALSQAQAAELTRLGRQIEAHFDAPQDIEWALVNQELFILQSRPITTLSGPAAVPGDDDWPPLYDGQSHPYDLWTQADVGERWPEPVTPFTWSIWAPVTQENMMVGFGAVADAEIESIQWIRRAYGRAYLNEGAMAFALNHQYGMPASSGASSFAAPQLIPPELDHYRWGTVLRRAPLLVGMTRSWEKNAAYFESQFPQIDSWVEAFWERDLAVLSERELWTEANGIWYERMMEYITYHANVTSMVTTAYGQVEGLAERATGDTFITQALTAGLSDVIAAEIVPLLWQMARTLRELGLESAVLEQEPAPALAALRQEPAAGPFLQQLEQFLQRHGHRCMSEAEYRYPRWREAPEQVLASVASYLQMEAGQFDPAAQEAAQKQKQVEAAAEVAAGLDPLRRIFFRGSLKRLQRLLRLRDNGQHFLVKLLLPGRVLYAELARRWAEKGWLAAADDFFFLVTEEIEQVLTAGEPGALDLIQTAVQRRKAYEYWLNQPFPEVLDAQEQPVELADPAGDDPDVLSGIAASQGEVTGPARVIHTPQEASQLPPGAILVTRATDPGWTPVFSVIGGLVLEVGGQLSHGAIVAREYGLPAVVNVAGATQKIEDGQAIRVDGSRGRVHLDPAEV